MACLREFEKVIDYIIGEIREGRAVVGSEIPRSGRSRRSSASVGTPCAKAYALSRTWASSKAAMVREITFLAAFPAASSVLST